MDQPPQRTGLRAFARIVRQNAGFRSLVIANAISQIGDWFDIVALIALLYAMTGKAQSVAFVLVTRWLPFFVAGPVAGVVADRMSRRSIMIVCDLLRAALVLAFLLVRNPGDVWIAYLVVILHSTASAFFEPAQSASIPSLVPPSDVYAATAMDNSLWSVSLAIGAVLGGLALRWAGRDAAFCIDAISFLGSAWFLRGLPENAAAAPSLEAYKAAILAGLAVTDELFRTRRGDAEAAGRITALTDDIVRLLPPTKRAGRAAAGDADARVKT